MGLDDFPTNKVEGAGFEGKYCNSEVLDNKLKDIISAIQEEDLATLEELGVKKMIKNTPTLILKANNEEGSPKRYHPGEQLVTYNNEFDENGLPVQETWGGGVANIDENSVILSNGLIKYPEGHIYEGEVVKGFYDNEGYFTVDQENGDTELNNEYVSDIEFVKDAYGVDADNEWQSKLKLVESYMSEITEDIGAVEIGDNNIRVEVGGSVAIDYMNDKVKSVRGISRVDLENTYIDFNEYLDNKK